MNFAKKKMAFIDLTNFKDWPMGGMLEYELAILKYLVKKYDVEIWGVSVDGKVNPSVDIDGVAYPIHVWGNVRTSKRIIPNYWRGLSIYFSKKNFEKDYDVVYSHTGSCLVALNYMIDKKKTLLVYHQHGLNHRKDFSLMSLLQRPLLNKAQKVADLVFVVSNPESVEVYAEEMQHKSKAKFVSMGSPINLKQFNEKQIRERIENRKVLATKEIVYTGRLSAFKNAKTLVEAFSKYLLGNPDAILKIAGFGEELDIIKKQIKEKGIENKVQLLGILPHEKIYQLLQNADVFATASGGEGVSVSVLEAYASGLPVICFRVSGLERQVIDHVTGIIAKEHAADGLFEAMKELDNCRTELALNCLDEAKKYNAESITEKIVTEIDGMMRKKISYCVSTKF